MCAQSNIGSVIDGLSADVEADWRRFDFDEVAFPSVARDCLARAELSACMDGFEISRHAAAPSAIQRPDHRAPEIVPLFRGQRFDIHAHFWLDSIANPHDHAWAGAFTVIEGRSLNGHHVFDERERVRSTMKLGQLRCDRLQVCHPGDIVEVRNGPSFIHSVAYSSRVGVAVSVRSKQRENPSLTYYRPGVGVEGRARDPEITGRLSALQFARSIDEARFVPLVEEVIRESDREMIFFTLVEAVERNWQLPAAVLAAGLETHGASFQLMLDSIADVHRHLHVVELRQDYQAPQLRALLAALYCCDDREQVARAISLLEPGGDPWLQVGGWLVTLLVDARDGEQAPAYFVQAFADIAAGHSVEEMQGRLLSLTDGDVPDRHWEFLASARSAMFDAPLYRALFTAA